MSRRFLSAVFAMSALALVACAPAKPASPEADAPDVKVDADGTVEVKTDEATVSNKQELPSEWPSDVPAYPGAAVQFSGTATNPETGKEGSAAMFTTTDTGTAVIDFYKAKIAAEGWTVSNTMQINGGTVLVAAKDDRVLTVSIASAEGQTAITIGTSKK
jgi:hypothetical protein